MAFHATLLCGLAPACAHAAAVGALQSFGPSSARAGSAAHAVPASASPQPSAKIDGLVAAMSNSSTWGHPDLFGEFSGMRLYAEGRYKDALRYFRIGARYADKPSELAIGLMYANGRGVARDPVKACAWLALAAERHYPNFVATRNRVCGALTKAERNSAQADLAKLLPVYGDAIAKQRMAFALRQARMQMTGSRTGFDLGIRDMRISALQGTPPTTPCGGPSMPGTSVAGCGGKDFWNPDRWDPKQYFAARDALFQATVEVGTLQNRRAAPANASSAGR